MKNFLFFLVILLIASCGTVTVEYTPEKSLASAKDFQDSLAVIGFPIYKNGTMAEDAHLVNNMPIPRGHPKMESSVIFAFKGKALFSPSIASLHMNYVGTYIYQGKSPNILMHVYADEERLALLSQKMPYWDGRSFPQAPVKLEFVETEYALIGQGLFQALESIFGAGMVNTE